METSQGPFRGTFVSDGNAKMVAVPSGVDYIKMTNRDRWGTAINDADAVDRYVAAEWYASMDDGSANIWMQAQSATDTALWAIQVASNGFTPIDPGNPQTFGTFALGNPAFSQATQGIWDTTTSHNYAVGDIVRVTGVTGARQYAGLDLSVIALTGADKFTSLLNTTAITQGTAGSVRKIASDGLFLPRWRYIASITQAASAVITLTVRHQFRVGEKVRIIVPDVFGMSEINSQIGTITAIDSTLTVNTITVDIDSSSYTTFAFPANADVPFTFAQVVPIGEVATTLAAAEVNNSTLSIQFGTDVVGADGENIDFWCFKGNQVL